MTTFNHFGAKTEASEVASAFQDNIKGKKFIITGASENGLGEAVAIALAAHEPGLLILTGRSLDKVNVVARKLAGAYPNVKTRALHLDLASFASVNRAVAEVLTAYREPAIDVLINNAGVMNVPERTLSEDGYELHLATNYLGPFLFTRGIAPKLAAAAAARVVNVSTNGHMFSPFRFADYNFDRNALPAEEQPPKAVFDTYGIPYTLEYSPVVAYGQSKTALILFTRHFAKESRDQGITAVALHPGAIETELWRHMPREVAEQMFKMLPMKTSSQAASVILVAALDPKLSGVYLSDCQPEEVASFAKDEAIAEKLWRETVELTKSGRVE